MLNRRAILGAAAAPMAWCLAGPARAEEAPPYGSPAPTSPYPPDVFRARRERLMAQIRGGVAVIYSKASLEERQDSDFAYLTGLWDEAGAALVLAPEERTYREALYLADRNPEAERYEGERLPLSDEIERRTGIARVRRTSRLAYAVMNYAARAPVLHFLGPLTPPPAPAPAALALYGEITSRVPGTSIRNSSGLIAAMRAAHEPREIDTMRRAIDATVRGLRAGMTQARVAMREYELKNIIESEFRAGGARGLAFPSIVGAGRSSAVLHYPSDEGVIRAGDLVLCDVGAEVDHYAADITRTFPIDGRFNDEQRRIYDLVLQAQEAARALLRPGVYYEDLQRAAERVFEAADVNDAFWHGLGHFVGLDVHDAGDMAQPLPVGAVVTIEPGLYLPERGFGVRIEDEFLVTRAGCEHLTSALPRTAAEIETFLAGAR